MHRLFERSAVLMICLLAFVMPGDFAAPVIALLISVAASAAVQIFTGKPAAWVIIAVCSAMCGAFPLLFCAVCRKAFEKPTVQFCRMIVDIPYEI